MTVRELEKLLLQDGWIAVKQVPIHKGDVSKGTANSILKQAGLK